MNLRTHSRKRIPLAHVLIPAGNAADHGSGHDELDVNELITGGREGFASYEVTGDSMADHIQPGNIVFVDTWAEPRDGDVIASTVNGLISIKIFRRQRGNLYLVSANKKYPPREVKANDSFYILGVVRWHLGRTPRG